MKAARIDRRKILFAGLLFALGQTAPITLKAAHSTFVNGTVYQSNGLPAISVWVTLQIGQQRLQFLTGNDGRYFIGYIDPGQYTISVSRNNITLYSEMIQLPAQERFDIRLP